MLFVLGVSYCVWWGSVEKTFLLGFFRGLCGGVCVSRLIIVVAAHILGGFIEVVKRGARARVGVFGGTLGKLRTT